jgi:hypothetical protein
MTTREVLTRLARHARLFVDCANAPVAGDDTTGCILIHDDTHFAQLEAALSVAEAHLGRGDAPS